MERVTVAIGHRKTTDGRLVFGAGRGLWRVIGTCRAADDPPPGLAGVLTPDPTPVLVPPTPPPAPGSTSVTG